MTEYCRESEIDMVYYLGTHMCSPKPSTKRNRSLVRERLFIEMVV